MKLTRQDYILAGGQALLWITLWLIPPAIDFFIRFNPSSAFEVWKINTGFITPLAIVFTANFYVLVPYLLYRDRKMLFGLMNLLLITGATYGYFLLRRISRTNGVRECIWSLSERSFYIC